jgi:MFS family permease
MVGLVILGIGMGTVVTPILSELVVAIKEKMGSASKEANDKASGLFTMCSALGSILGLIIGGSLFETIKINWTMNIYSFLCFCMAIIYFLMNIWPGFLLSPVLDLPESELGLGIPINNANPGQSVRMTRQIQEALAEKAHESRLVLSVRGSIAGDIIFPVTNEQKIYLAGIDEEDDEDESLKL